MSTGEKSSGGEVEEFLAIRKAEGLKIDPDTAEVYWEYGPPGDPYGVYPEPPPEGDCIGRIYFARSPDSDIWVHFGDLPQNTRDAIEAWPEEKWRANNDSLFLAAIRDD
jgi:hypothetical protein